MSSHRHIASVQSRSRQVILGVTLTGLSVLTACTGAPSISASKADFNAPPVKAKALSVKPKALSVKPKPLPVKPKTLAINANLGQNPIDAPVTKVNNTTLPSKPEADPEESDMTVLVLEDRDLLALASRMPPPANLIGEPAARPDPGQFRFAFDAHRLNPEAEAILRQHGQYLRANPDQKAYLTGHTDAQGPEAYNLFLSRLRATAAARILKEEGAREHQIELAGAGSSKPIAPGDHAANRRLELTYDDSRLATRE